ncbi:MAG: sigma-70 family RNA polymerase sigma factor [Flavitalea sp.]
MTMVLKSSDLFNAKSGLIIKLKQKDLPSFELLFDLYASTFCSLVESITKNPETTSELMVKLFSTVYKIIDEFDENKNTLFIWMLGIARTIALEAKAKSDFVIESEDKSHFSALKTITGLEHLIDQLPDDCRTILQLSYFEGMNTKVIAQFLNKNIEDVKLCKNKGLVMIAKLMGMSFAYPAVNEIDPLLP